MENKNESEKDIRFYKYLLDRIQKCESELNKQWIMSCISEAFIMIILGLLAGYFL